MNKIQSNVAKALLHICNIIDEMKAQNKRTADIKKMCVISEYLCRIIIEEIKSEAGIVIPKTKLVSPAYPMDDDIPF